DLHPALVAGVVAVHDPVHDQERVSGLRIPRAIAELDVIAVPPDDLAGPELAAVGDADVDGAGLLGGRRCEGYRLLDGRGRALDAGAGTGRADREQCDRGDSGREGDPGRGGADEPPERTRRP